MLSEKMHFVHFMESLAKELKYQKVTSHHMHAVPQRKGEATAVV
jgi:hypothetical protein